MSGSVSDGPQHPDEVAYRLHRDGECAGVGDCEWCNDEVEATHVEENDAF